MLSKDQKMKMVEEGQKELSKYSLVGVVPLNGIPDRLVQRSRNGMRQQVRFITGKKSLLTRILEGNAKTKPLVKELVGTSAIILSNEDPFAIYKTFRANTIKLAAKPNQISPEDIPIASGETSLQPGQTVTELKQAGIDVQIQKGKVVIAKDKILVKKGAVITSAVAKALKTLDIMPFSATIAPSVMLSGNIMFTKAVLGIDQAQVLAELTKSFSAALSISLQANIVNNYTIVTFIERAYRGAFAVGLEAKLPIPGIVERLVGNAALGASALNAMIKTEPAPPAA